MLRLVAVTAQGDQVPETVGAYFMRGKGEMVNLETLAVPAPAAAVPVPSLHQLSRPLVRPAASGLALG
jgi:hypothetical protein